MTPQSEELKRMRSALERSRDVLHGVIAPWVGSSRDAIPESVRSAVPLHNELHELLARAPAPSPSPPPVDLGRACELLRGLLGLVQLVCMRDDMPRGINEALRRNHRYLDALCFVEQTAAPGAKVPGEASVGRTAEASRPPEVRK